MAPGLACGLAPRSGAERYTRLGSLDLGHWHLRVLLARGATALATTTETLDVVADRLRVNPVDMSLTLANGWENDRVEVLERDDGSIALVWAIEWSNIRVPVSDAAAALDAIIVAISGCSPKLS